MRSSTFRCKYLMLGRRIINEYWREMDYVEFYAIGAFVKDRLVRKYVCINNVCDTEFPKNVKPLYEEKKPPPVIDRNYSDEGDFKVSRIILNSEGLEIVEEGTYYTYEYLINGVLVHHRDVRRRPAMPWRRISRSKGFMKVKGEVIFDGFASALLIYKLFKVIVKGGRPRIDKKLKIVDVPSADPWGKISYDDKGFRAEEKTLIESGTVNKDFRGMLRRGFGNIQPTPRSLYVIPLKEDVEGKQLVTYVNGKFYLWKGEDGPYETEVDINVLKNVEAVGNEVQFERLIDERGIPISIGSPMLKVVIE